MDRLFAINTPSIVSEIIDGEVIILNLKTGNYYSSDKVGAVVWSWIEAGKSEAAMTRLAAERYQATDEAICQALQAYFARLLEEQLVREAPAHDGHNGSTAESTMVSQEPFIAPELCMYSDMKDLLFLDPIHDVDTVGWPTPKDGTPQ